MAPVAAHAEPPVKGGVEGESAVKKRYRFGGILDFPVKTPQAEDLLLVFPGGLPGITSGETRHVALDAAGTGTVRLHLTPWAAKIAKRYARTKLTVLVVIEREDGRFWSMPAQSKRTVLIR